MLRPEWTSDLLLYLTLETTWKSRNWVLIKSDYYIIEFWNKSVLLKLNIYIIYKWINKQIKTNQNWRYVLIKKTCKKKGNFNLFSVWISFLSKSQAVENRE